MDRESLDRRITRSESLSINGAVKRTFTRSSNERENDGGALLGRDGIKGTIKPSNRVDV